MRTRLHTAPIRPARCTQALSASCALLLTVSGGASAVTIPNAPLQTGTSYPEPNIWFILDDSGSMGYTAMPRDISRFSSLDNDITDKSYVHNTIYYNPNTTYRPWIKADGTRMTGGTSFTAACSSDSFAGPTCSTTDLSNDTQVYFVPRAGITDINDATQYDRYEIKNVSGSLRVVKEAANTNQNWQIDLGGDAWWYRTITVPSGATSLTVRISGGSNNRDADLYLRFNAAPTLALYDCRPYLNGNNETCTINNPSAGTWHIGVHNYSNRSNNNIDVSASIAAVTYGTPTGRSEADEITNFATWYSYHRTRMKTAKAGASEAFSQVGSNLRIGFDTINRNTTGLPYRIPVSTNNGLFSGTSKTTWYSRLFDADADNSTPLRRALTRAGSYFQESGSSGPWGPESGDDQVSCRQNFAILTTDGFWNGTLSSTVGNSDNTDGPVYTSTTGVELGYERSRPYRDSWSNTLADVAMEYWKYDLRGDLDNNVPVSTDNPAFWQNMVTFGVSIGLRGTLDPANDLRQLELGTKSWPDPTDQEDLERIDDLWHASVNGHGTFVQANDTTQFTEGLLDAFTVVAQRQGSASNVTANSTSFTTDTRVYQASYVSGRWSGELAAYPATSAGAASTPSWRASEGIPTSGRRVYTWNGTTGANFPTASQLTLLDQSTRPRAPLSGADNANYIKGTRTAERQNGGDARNRDSALGDIVYSSPIYVQELSTIFVGANDGMLHAFNVDTGVERFAYVPAGIDIAALGGLSDPYYTHHYFVDGPISISEDSELESPGHNYLVGTLGRGGKGLYALDVSDPASFGTGDVMWELTSGSNLGYVLGEPVITRLNDDDKTPVAIFGNGVNSASGHAVLYVVNLATGDVLQEIDTGVGSDNALFAPRGWDEERDEPEGTEGRGLVDYVYAGDLKGNLWKFDFRSGTGVVANTGSPLFRTASNQPITAAPALAEDPETNKRWVFAATGRFLSLDDLTTTDTQAIYGMIDDNAGTTIPRSSLEEREFVYTTTSSGRPIRSLEEDAELTAGKKGWYIELGNPTAGERVIERPKFVEDTMVVSSIIPPVEGGTCEAGGAGYLNLINPFTGGVGTIVFDTNGDGEISDDDKVNDHWVTSIDINIGQPTLPVQIDNRLFAGGSTGALGSVGIGAIPGASSPSSAQRVSWRELVND